MSVFPATPVPSQGVKPRRSRLSALCGPYPGGQSVGVSLRYFGLFSYIFNYRFLTTAELDAFQTFHDQRAGRAGTFTFIDWWIHAWTRLYVGVATAGQTVFDLPAVSTTGLVLRKNGTVLTLTTQYTITLAGGADGRDRVTLTSGATAGDLLDCDASCKVVFVARFTSDYYEPAEGEATDAPWAIGPVEILEVRS